MKIPLKNSLTDIRTLVEVRKQEKLKNLLQFSKNKLIEYKVISEKSTSHCDFRVSNRESRKLFKKIYVSQYNRLVKKIPFLEFWNVDVAITQTNTNSMKLEIPICMNRISIPFTSLKNMNLVSSISDSKSAYGNVNVKNMLNELIKSGDVEGVSTLDRYLKYINYKSAVNRCPIRLTQTYEVVNVSNIDPSAVSELTSSSIPPMEVIVYTRICAIATSWFWVLSPAVGPGYYDYDDFDSSLDTYSNHPECSIFNILVYIPEISNIIKTLIRRGSFDGNAYVI